MTKENVNVVRISNLRQSQTKLTQTHSMISRINQLQMACPLFESDGVQDSNEKEENPYLDPLTFFQFTIH